MLDYRRTNGLILSVDNWQEAGATVILLTRQLGKIIAFAPGLKKVNSKLAANILPGNIVYLTLVKRRHWYITGAKTVRPLARLLTEVANFKLAAIARECLLNLIPLATPDKKIFNQAVNLLEILGDEKYNIGAKEIICYRFLFALFAYQGVLPRWDICQHCGKKSFKETVSYWHPTEGVICFVSMNGVFKEVSTAVPLSLLKLFQQKKIFVKDGGLTDSERQLWRRIIKDIYAKETNKELVSLIKFRFSGEVRSF